MPTAHIPAISTRFSPPDLPTLALTRNLTTDVTWRAVVCAPADLPAGPSHKAGPITHPSDCFQAVLAMLDEGSHIEHVVWDGQRKWVHGSCGLFLGVTPATPPTPIPRDTFSRNDIAQRAESIRQRCVNEEHGYRGGIAPIAAGVFQVFLLGKPTPQSLGEWEQGIVLNATAVE